ncbi:MAG: erythromycin esterase family protein [Verrucomicrobiales bacterium]
MPDQVMEAIRAAAVPLEEGNWNFDAVLEDIGERKYVLIGEASHGTHEFYQYRADLTRKLITEKGFNVVAVEADWPDANRVNRWVQGRGDDSSALESLEGFKRFPTWMWRNRVVLQFVEWLRKHNDQFRQVEKKTGFYGMDLYSLHSSVGEVLKYLEQIDPANAAQARKRYSCFDHFGDDSQAYGYAASSGFSDSCEEQVIKQLLEIKKNAKDYANRDGTVAEDEYFFAEQNARLVKNAEEYYRSMYRGRVSSWNLRDTHMFETLELLVKHLESQNRHPKVVVWAHNSHLGNASATTMSERGEFNVGQLIRDKHPRDSFLLGFTTYDGTVTAASDWGEPFHKKTVNPGMRGSYERLFHETEIDNFYLPLRRKPVWQLLREPPRLERAIGVIYRPDTEFYSHYFNAKLPEQFDAVVHFDHTGALEPLDRSPHWRHDEAPETFPTGM